MNLPLASNTAYCATAHTRDMSLRLEHLLLHTWPRYPANIIYELWIMQHFHGLTDHLTVGPTDQLSDRLSNRVNAHLAVDPNIEYRSDSAASTTGRSLPQTQHSDIMTSDRTQSSRCETNGTRSLPTHQLWFIAKNWTINASFTAMPVCLRGRMNRKFTVAKGLSKNRIHFPGLVSFFTQRNVTQRT